MATITVHDEIQDIAPGTYTVSVVVKDTAGHVVGSSTEVTVEVPVSVDTPTVTVA